MADITKEQKTPARVFLSSTSEDIPTFRQAAIRVVQSIPWTVCVFMENYGARGATARLVDDNEVASCDIYIGILGFDYGKCPTESRLSFTELEYDAAVASGKPRLMFLYEKFGASAEGKAWNMDARQQRFRSRVARDHVVEFFETTVDLVAGILKALRTYAPKDTSDDAQARPLPASWADIPGPPASYLARAPGMDAAFAGRGEDLVLLNHWISRDETPVFVVQALGGMGKTCLARYWVDRYANSQCAETAPVFWWSFGDGESSFADFVDEALIYISNGRILPHEFLSDADRVRILRLLLDQVRVILVLDGFEWELHAYGRIARSADDDSPPEQAAGCIDRSASEFMSAIRGLTRHGAKVLVTTRILPLELVGLDGGVGKGTVVRSLVGLSEEETVAWFRQCKIVATRAQIAEVCAPYEFHPLTVRVIIAHIVTGLRHLDAFRAASDCDPLSEVASGKNHVLDIAIASLSSEAREVLCVLAAFQYSVPLIILDSLIGGLSEGLEPVVRGLVIRGLVDFSLEKRTCSLHAIVRGYVYRTVEDKSALHESIRRRLVVLVPEKVDWGDRNQSALLLELFRQTALSSRAEEAASMFMHRLALPLWRRADFLLARTLGETLMTREMHAQLSPVTKLTLVNSLSAYSAFLGESGDAAALIGRALGSFEVEGRRPGELNFTMRSNLAYYQIRLGDLVSAEQSLRNCMAQIPGRGSVYNDGYVPLRLALLQSYRGRFRESRSLLRVAMFTFEGTGSRTEMDGSCHVWAYRVWRALHMDRPRLAYQCAAKALQVARHVRDERLLARGQFHMGAALARLAIGARSPAILRKSESFLADALAHLRSLRLVEFEPACLRELAEVAIHAGRTGEAGDYLDEALSLARRCSYRFDEAEIWHTSALLCATTGDFSRGKNCLESALECAVPKGQQGNTYVALAERVRQKLESQNSYA